MICWSDMVRCGVQTAQSTYDKIKGAGGSAELQIYDKVGHAFMNGFTKDAIDKMNGAALALALLGNMFVCMCRQSKHAAPLRFDVCAQRIVS